MPDNTSSFAAMPTVSIPGREIFACGTWTDSDGHQREWTEQDLDTMIRKFRNDPEPIPLKAGHTEDVFNAQLAEQLDLPNLLLTGDEGNGAIRFGVISDVIRDGTSLKADFGEVPEKIRDLIQGGQYNQVSCEITLEDDGPRLTAVALLGAEPPAVKGMKPLSAFAEKGGPWVTFKFQGAEPDTLMARYRDSIDSAEDLTVLQKWAAKFAGGDTDHGDGRPQKGWWDRAMAAARMFPQLGDPAAFAGRVWFTNDPFPQSLFDTPESSIQAVGQIHQWLAQQQNGGIPEMTMQPLGGVAPEQTPNPEEQPVAQHQLNPEDLPRLYEALGLPDTAGIDEVLMAIEEMKGGVNPEDGGMLPPTGEQMSDAEAARFAEHPAVVKLTQQVAELAKENQDWKREATRMKFKEMAQTWTGIPGTPDELADELTELQETAGDAIAQKVIASYQKMHDAAVDQHVFTSIGSAKRQQRELGDDEFATKVMKYAEDNGVTKEKALATMAVQDPQGFRQHMQNVKQSA